MTAFLLAERGTPFAAEYQRIVEDPRSRGQITWFVSAPRGAVSQYPPGSSLFAVPLYLVADAELTPHLDLSRYVGGMNDVLVLPDIWPSSTTAAVVTALALSTMYAVLRGTDRTQKTALVAVSVFGLGTAVWTVAADSLWQHGPAMLMISMVMLYGLRLQWVPMSVAAAALVVVRPTVVLISVPVMVGIAIQNRSWKLLVGALGGTVFGLSVLAGYNRLVFESWSLAGGYGSSFASNVLQPDLGTFLRNLVGAIFSVERGVATWSPFVIAGAVALPLVWSELDLWMKWAVGGGVAYLLVQYLANRFSGGTGFSYYRYPLETMIVALPAGSFSVQRIAQSELMANRVVLKGMIAWSLLVHAIAATGWR